jgi:ubiquinone/menaquinone biosynthesis C-methylase UbiE
MRQSIIGITKTLQSSYDEQYTDQMTEWREICGKYKAANILNVCKNHKFTKVLECGAGEGSILKFLDASDVFAELDAIEISDSGVSQILRRNLHKLKDVKKFNGYEIPYPDNEFDMAYCSHVIEHVEHPRLLLRELKRVSYFQVFEIPLDYSIGIDLSINFFLSYGHINIFTPSLFKFLLKSEGYKIITELLTHTEREVMRFSWNKDLKTKKNYYRELVQEIYPLRKFLKRIVYSRKRYEEFGYNNYTCLAKGVGDLMIFQSR